MSVAEAARTLDGDRDGVADEVVGLQAEVDEAAALLERRPPAVVVARLVEADQLDVGAVLEGDQAVVGPDPRVPAAGDDREAEVGVVPGRRLQAVHRDHQMIDPEQHQRPPNAGATSLTKRANWPRWSHEVSRSAMWPRPASR